MKNTTIEEKERALRDRYRQEWELARDLLGRRQSNLLKKTNEFFDTADVASLKAYSNRLLKAITESNSQYSR